MVKTTSLYLLRHGPKNNNVEAHQTGVEALLDPTRIGEIKAHAESLHGSFTTLHNLMGGDRPRIRIETTPIERAKATGRIVADEMSAIEAFYRMVAGDSILIAEPVVNELIGSSGIHSETSAAINLGPRAMSKVWGNAKKQDNYKGQQGEHRPLYAWCEQGFDNPQAGNPEDPGISLREIACRVGAYVLETIQGAGPTDYVVAYGHSGDIEPFMYLCLEMLDGRDGSDGDAMVRRFSETGGALQPLDGVMFTYLDNALEFTVPNGTEERYAKDIGLEILQEQANWFRQYSKSQDVLEQRLRMEKGN